MKAVPGSREGAFLLLEKISGSVKAIKKPRVAEENKEVEKDC